MIKGRNVLNIWRLAESELKLNSYTLSSVYEKLFQIKVLFYNESKLSLFYFAEDQQNYQYRHIVYDYYSKYNLSPKLDVGVITDSITKYSYEYEEVCPFK